MHRCQCWSVEIRGEPRYTDDLPRDQESGRFSICFQKLALLVFALGVFVWKRKRLGREGETGERARPCRSIAAKTIRISCDWLFWMLTFTATAHVRLKLPAKQTHTQTRHRSHNEGPWERKRFEAQSFCCSHMPVRSFRFRRLQRSTNMQVTYWRLYKMLFTGNSAKEMTSGHAQLGN